MIRRALRRIAKSLSLLPLLLLDKTQNRSTPIRTLHENLLAMWRVVTAMRDLTLRINRHSTFRRNNRNWLRPEFCHRSCSLPRKPRQEFFILRRQPFPFVVILSQVHLPSRYPSVALILSRAHASSPRCLMSRQ